jgi:hypothetical protein
MRIGIKLYLTLKQDVAQRSKRRTASEGPKGGFVDHGKFMVCETWLNWVRFCQGLKGLWG